MLEQLEASFVFPAPSAQDGDWSPDDLQQEDAWFESEDGTRLHGWYVEPRGKSPLATILFSHGNGEHVAWQADLLQFFRDELRCAILAWDYRGYGRSEGSPTERGILADALAAQRWLALRTGKNTTELTLMGRSLGAAVATYQAITLGARQLVLQSGFTSIPEVAAHHFPWLPVTALLRTQLPAQDWIARYHGPLLLSHAVHDEIVPFSMGETLFRRCPSESKKFIRIERGGHNDPLPRDYFDQLAEFLSESPPT